MDACPDGRRRAAPSPATSTPTSAPSSAARSSRTSSGSSPPTQNQRDYYLGRRRRLDEPADRRPRIAPTATSSSSTGRSAPSTSWSAPSTSTTARTTPASRLNSSPETAATRTQKTPTPGLGYTGILSDKTVRRGPLLGLLRRRDHGPHRSRPAPRPQPLLRRRHRLHLRRALLLVRPRAPRAPRSPPRSRTSPTSSSARATTSSFGVQYSQAAAARARRLQRPRSTPTARRDPSYGYGISYTPFSYSGDTPRARRLLRRHDARERPPVAQPRPALRLPEGLLGRARPARRAGQPTGVTYPQTDFFTWNTISPRIGFNLKLTERRPDRPQGPLGPLPPGGGHRGVRQQDRPEHHADLRRAPTTFASGTVRGPHPVAIEREPGLRPELREPVHRPVHREPASASWRQSLGAQLNYVNKRGRKYAAWNDITGVVHARALRGRHARRRPDRAHASALPAAERSRGPPVPHHQPGRLQLGRQRRRASPSSSA